MSCEELRDHYDAYALDIADEAESREIHAHLERGCEVCTAGVKKALEAVTAVALSAPDAQPSARLRRRILASVGSEPRPMWTFSWIFAAAAVMLAVVTVYFALTNRRYSEQVAALEAELHSQNAQLSRLAEVFAIVSGPQTVEATFGGAQPRPPQGRVFMNPARGIVLIASNLPRTSSGKIYEMWIIPRASTAKPVAAGLFQSQEDGSAVHIRAGVVDAAAAAAIAVTVENEAGADQPTTTPLIVAPLAAAQ
jgi:hypothetical protein